VDKIFRWLSGNKQKPTPAQDLTNTAPLSEQQIQAIVTHQNPRFDLQQLISSCGQSVGKQRTGEDSLLTITAMMAGNAGNLPFGLYIIADGMGGHQFGEGPARCDPHRGRICLEISSLSLPHKPIRWMNHSRRSCRLR
jgi:hypothetical protein